MHLRTLIPLTGYNANVGLGQLGALEAGLRHAVVNVNSMP